MMQLRYVIFTSRTSIFNLTHDYHQATELDPPSPWGYEMRHAVLHKAGDYDGAVLALDMMLSKMQESSDPDIQSEFLLR